MTSIERTDRLIVKAFLLLNKLYLLSNTKVSENNDTFKQYISMNLSKGNISMSVLPSTYKMRINKFIHYAIKIWLTVIMVGRTAVFY